MVGQRTLNPFILVRIQVQQPVKNIHNMNKNLLRDIELIIKRIQDGTLSGVEMRALLISVRYANPHSVILEELGDFVAHYDVRNQGILYEHVDNFMSKFIDFSLSGGRITIPSPPFNQEDVVADLIRIIKHYNVAGFVELKFRRHTFDLMYKILEIVADTKILTSKVNNCGFSDIENNGDKHIVSFYFGPINGKILNIAGKVQVAALIAVNNKTSI
jgi:hypothetical protein